MKKNYHEKESKKENEHYNKGEFFGNNENSVHVKDKFSKVAHKRKGKKG